MKQFFTRVTFLFLLLSMGSNLQAQHILEITEPENVAGFYVGGGAAFYTRCVSEPLVGEIVEAIGEIVQVSDTTQSTPNEGCGTIINDVSGKIALLDRGSCFFEQKALNAQAAGAIALIICNNLPDSNEDGGLFGLGDAEEITDPVNIPILGLSREGCANFRVALPLTGSITNFFFIPDNDLAVIWGDEIGQGDFNGGNNGWSSVGTTCSGSPEQPGPASDYITWRWKENATADQGAFSEGATSIRSPSACNGAMVFDSEFHDNKGEDISIGQGPCPTIQGGSLVSPPIDLSGVSGGLALSFHQKVKQFTSEFYVGYSIDGGTTWREYPINTKIEIFDEISTEESSYQIVPLYGAAGINNLQVRFRMIGDYYNWIIDDVKIIENFQNELIIADFFYTPASASQPVSQIANDPFLFEIFASNYGAIDQTNVVFKAQVLELFLDANGNLTGVDLEYEDSIVVATIPKGVDTVLTIEELYQPDLEPGTYVIRYSLTQSEGDDNPSNNVEVATFTVTESTFSKDLSGGNNITRNGGEEKHAYANIYSIAAETKEKFVLDNIAFRSFLPEEEGFLDGNTVNVYLMRATDEVDESLGNFNLASTDITAEGQLEFAGISTDYTFPSGSGNGDFFETTLENFESDSPIIKLEPGKRYFAMTEYPTESAHIYQIYSTEINYTFRSSLLLTDRWYTGLQGRNGFAPVIRMNLALSTAVDEVALPDGAMSLYPNPATDYIQAQFDLENQLDATITLSTIDGKVIEYRNLPLQKEVIKFKTNNLADGMYLLRVATKEGTQTKKFLVKRP